MGRTPFRAATWRNGPGPLDARFAYDLAGKLLPGRARVDSDGTALAEAATPPWLRGEKDRMSRTNPTLPAPPEAPTDEDAKEGLADQAKPALWNVAGQALGQVSTQIAAKTNDKQAGSATAREQP